MSEHESSSDMPELERTLDDLYSVDSSNAAPTADTSQIEATSLNEMRQFLDAAHLPDDDDDDDDDDDERDGMAMAMAMATIVTLARRLEREQFSAPSSAVLWD